MQEPKIYQCIPGSGKTFLAEHNPRFTDSDALLAELGLKGKSGYDSVLSDPALRVRFVGLINDALISTSVLCNFDPEELGLRCDGRYSYRRKEYTTHLLDVGRMDLLTSFSVLQLQGWAQGYYDKDNVVFMDVGQFVSDYLL